MVVTEVVVMVTEVEEGGAVGDMVVEAIGVAVSQSFIIPFGILGKLMIVVHGQIEVVNG